MFQNVPNCSKLFQIVPVGNSVGAVGDWLKQLKLEQQLIRDNEMRLHGHRLQDFADSLHPELTLMSHLDAEAEFQEVSRFDDQKAANEWDGVVFFGVEDPQQLLEQVQRKNQVQVAI